MVPRMSPQLRKFDRCVIRMKRRAVSIQFFSRSRYFILILLMVFALYTMLFSLYKKISAPDTKNYNFEYLERTFFYIDTFWLKTLLKELPKGEKVDLTE